MEFLYIYKHTQYSYIYYIIYSTYYIYTVYYIEITYIIYHPSHQRIVTSTQRQVQQPNQGGPRVSKISKVRVSWMAWKFPWEKDGIPCPVHVIMVVNDG